jgi:Zn-dependent metalloprotease
MAQSNADLLKTSSFKDAIIRLDKAGKAAAEIRFLNEENISVTEFFKEYKRVFHISDENEARSFSDMTDKLGTRHYRFNQYYKGIELAEVQYLLHEKNGKVYLAHGNFIPGLNLSVTPVLTEDAALQRALKYINALEYLWENPKNSASLKQQLGNTQADFYPKGKLMLTAGREEMLAENFRLVYRFDIFATNPLSHYYIDIDAATGELVNKLSRMNTDNVQSKGVSLYNDTVTIIVSDEDFPNWNDSTNWHPDDWNAYGGVGESWWIANTLLGTHGGYDNYWYQVLETDPIILTGENPELSFYHRYSVEDPSIYGLYDGWDGMNVRISTDNGVTWEVIANPVPAYTCSSLYGFGDINHEGPGIPGWAGLLDEWTKVSFDLSLFVGETIKLRFAFASDEAVSASDGNPDLFGWQVDEIIVSNSTDTLYSNMGEAAGLEAKNLFSEVNFVAGKYRLRETTRGMGIATYNAKGSESFYSAEDFVEEDSLFSDSDNQTGVSLHWAQEMTYDYFLNRHGRLGINEINNRLVAYANILFGDDPNNAMWAGSFSFFGSGDGILYGPFVSLDIVGHELAHGVTQYSANLVYENESGALNESFSDIFGTSAEYFVEGNENGDWIIGENIVLTGTPLRSMENPKLYGQPDTYGGNYWVAYTNTPDAWNDYGGVHTNSGVQNYWYFLLVNGGNGSNDNGDEFSFAGIGLADAEQIAYRNLTVYLQPTSDYHDAAVYSAQSASDLFGESSLQHLAVKNAWYAVGIYSDPRIEVPASITIYARPEMPGSTTILLGNAGFEPLQINDIQISGAGFQTMGSLSFPIGIAFDENYQIGIEFTPEMAGTTKGSLSITSNDPENPEKTLVLTGINTLTAVEPLISNSSSTVKLYQNYPNPFNSSTRIRYNLPENTSVMIKIFNLTGNKVRDLVDSYQAAGLNSATWDGTDNSSQLVQPGVYLYTLQTADEHLSGRLIYY